jgi:hypothetical protein
LASRENPAKVHERLGNAWWAWTWWVHVLEESAGQLEENASYTEHPKGHIVMPATFSVRAMLLGYAIECAVKGLWVRSGKKIVKDGKFVGVPVADHDLLRLSKIVGFSPSTAETNVLEKLTKFIRFAGRYPIAKNANDMVPYTIPTVGPVDVGFFFQAGLPYLLEHSE